MLLDYKKAVLLAFVAVLVCWPPIHMGLSTHLGFSSWKFAGWGMYATPYTPNKILQLHIVPERVSNAWRGPEQLRLPAASLQRIFETFRWNRDGFTRVGLTYSRDDLRREVKRIKILGSSGPVEELANNIIEAGNFQEEATKLLFFVIQPRIHPLQLVAYAEVNAYLFQDGRVVKRVAFRTDERRVKEVFMSMTKAPITHAR